jgi:hypothetical protein
MVAAVLLQGLQAQNAVFSYNKTAANATISNATDYINLINLTSYLFFSPNLTLAYYYLNKSHAAYNKSPSLAADYANKAYAAAKEQGSKIDSYKRQSVWLVILVIAVSGLLLYLFMRPVKKGARRNRRG